MKKLPAVSFQLKTSYRSALFLSLAAHSVLGLILVLMSANPLSLGKKGNAENAALLMKTLDNLHISGPEANQIMGKMNSAEMAFDPAITAAQRLETMNALVHSLRNSAAAKKEAQADTERAPLDEIFSSAELKNGILTSSGDRVFAVRPPAGGEGIRFEKLDRDDMKKLAKTMANEELEKDIVSVTKGNIILDPRKKEEKRFLLTKSTALAIPEQYYFRKSPYDKIIASGANLFAFSGGFGNLSDEKMRSDFDASSQKKSAAVSRAEANDRMDIVFVDLKIKKASSILMRKSGLNLSGEEITKILDNLMQLPEKAQFERMRQDYWEKYDADSGSLAELTESFFEGNLNGLFFEVNAVSTAFDYLEELYFKRAIYDYLPRYGRDNGATKTGSLILLYLAASYDFEKRTLMNISNAYDEANDSFNKGYILNNLFNSRAKAFTVKRVYEQIGGSIKRLRIKSLKDLYDRYTEQQKAIFDVLIKADDEYRDRGLYAAGKLAWEGGDFQTAIGIWGKIDPQAAIEPYQMMKPYMGNSVDKKIQIAKIQNVFIALEISGNNRRHLARLVQYDKWKKREES